MRAQPESTMTPAVAAFLGKKRNDVALQEGGMQRRANEPSLRVDTPARGSNETSSVTTARRAAFGASQWALRGLASALLLLLSVRCGGDDEDPPAPDDGGDRGDCIAPLSLECEPTFDPPTFDDIFDSVLQPSCGSSTTGSQCHSETGRQLGLVLQQREKAYDSLLGTLDGRARVIPNKPECSELVKRLESADRKFRMPANADPLDEHLRCAVRLWIAEGARR